MHIQFTIVYTTAMNHRGFRTLWGHHPSIGGKEKEIKSPNEVSRKKDVELGSRVFFIYIPKGR